MADDNRVEIQFGASTGEALTGIAEVRQALAELTAQIASAGGSLEGLGGKLGAALSTDKIAESTRGMESFGNAAQRAASQTKAIGEDIKSLQQGLAQKKILLDAEVKQYEITQDQKYALLETETQKEYEAQLKVLQHGLTTDGLTLQSKETLVAKIKALEEKHDTDMLRLDEQSIAAQQAQWTKYLSSVTSAFNSQLRGLLEGTTSWHTAMKKTLEELTIKFIEMAEETVVHWLAAEVAKTTATTTGVAARKAAEQSAGSASILTAIGNAMKSIFASAGQTSAEVSAAVAPESGPAAPAIGAAAGTSVMASSLALAGMTYYDVGTDYVLRGGLAVVHQGEQIKPAVGTGPYTGKNEASGDTHVNLNISALDSRSIERFFNDNAGQMIRALNKGIKNGAHLGLRSARA